MFRIFKTALADVDGRLVPAARSRTRRAARSPPTCSGGAARRAPLTAATAALGTYLGSYTGVLLASTAVPAWHRSRRFLPPIFICTATRERRRGDAARARRHGHRAPAIRPGPAWRRSRRSP